MEAGSILVVPPASGPVQGVEGPKGEPPVVGQIEAHLHAEEPVPNDLLGRGEDVGARVAQVRELGLFPVCLRHGHDASSARDVPRPGQPVGSGDVVSLLQSEVLEGAGDHQAELRLMVNHPVGEQPAHPGSG